MVLDFTGKPAGAAASHSSSTCSASSWTTPGPDTRRPAEKVERFHQTQKEWAIDAETSQLLRDLTLDPAKDYQPLDRPPGPGPKPA
ncbi:hypothetical protein EKO23_15665 [Nocardioides guangzhouensis]|uniref:Uncharacterized protein n=1 Tax=Nocardioides guangzhouensis TaxID=2497878 RepID=A0A4Q4Z974_9ACTN|nr:hypothetical protein [Nocardioides guangzhouensis]RYP84457.1 hypothetical protein EKO23_15665 [Nocardioides guangzhouensis]